MLLNEWPQVDLGVAAFADDQGLPSSAPHGFNLAWCGLGAVPVEVGESSDVVDGDPVSRLAQFADSSGEPLDEAASPLLFEGHAPSMIGRACLRRRRGMPSNLAVNILPAGVRWTASKHRRFPNGSQRS